jgi:dipeptidase E
LPADTKKCLGIVDFALHPHLNHKQFPSNSLMNLEKLGDTIPMPSYMIDDNTAIKVTDGNIEVISEGQWKLFTPDKTTNRFSI